jgi:membrane protease YdiL (CAAX protease family)
LVPSTVAILLVALLHGRRGVRKLLGRLLMGRIGLRWYVAVLLLPMLVPLGVGLSVVFGGSDPAVDATIASAIFLLAFSIFPGSAMGEELGWRGFALPHLQRDHSALGASLVIGAFWGFWHLPLWLTGTDSHPPSMFPTFVLAVIATSVICTWLYNSTGGSLLIVVLYHATANLPITLLVSPLGEQGARPFWIYVALLVVVTGAIVVATGPANLSRTQPKQIAVP